MSMLQVVQTGLLCPPSPCGRVVNLVGLQCRLFPLLLHPLIKDHCLMNMMCVSVVPILIVEKHLHLF